MILKLKNRIDERLNDNFLAVILFMVVICITRNLLEACWGHFGMSIEVFINTATYVFMMIIAEGYLINRLLGGRQKELRQLIQRGIWLLLCLFIIIPIFNIIFHGILFELPIWHELSFLPFPHYPHYGPAGIHVAFLLVLFYFPSWLRKIYGGPPARRYGRTWIIYIIHYILYYQVTLLLFRPFTFRWGFSAWSASFIVPVIIILPMFAKMYAMNPMEKGALKKFNIALYVLFGSLVGLAFYLDHAS